MSYENLSFEIKEKQLIVTFKVWCYKKKKKNKVEHLGD